MRDIILLSDTSCDISPSIADSLHMELIPFYVSFDQHTYFKEHEDISVEDFYGRMREQKIFPKTSLPSIDDYLSIFKTHIKNNKKVICVCLSSKFSGSYSSAINAREIILEEYPDADLEVIDSLNATMGQGLLVREISRMIDSDYDFDTIITTIPRLVDKAKIFFYVDTLDYLEHSGRIGKASAFLGTMLNVKPVLYLENGELFPAHKVRGKKKARAKVAEMLAEYIGEHLDHYHYLIAHADTNQDAIALNETVHANTSITVPDDYSLIGTTIGVNTGPDACGIAVIPKFETLLD